MDIMTNGMEWVVLQETDGFAFRMILLLILILAPLIVAIVLKIARLIAGRRKERILLKTQDEAGIDERESDEM